MPRYVEITDGHPAPYALTVQGAPDIAAAAEEWLRGHKPSMQVERIDGEYVYYAHQRHVPTPVGVCSYCGAPLC